MSKALALFVAFVALSLAPRAWAAPSGTIALSPGGPLELTPQGKEYAGAFFVENVGASPLSVSRVSVRTDSDDPRVPEKMTVKPERPTPFVVAPHERVRVSVAWAPDASRGQQQALGHVVVTSTDEAAGEVAMGFRAQLPTPLSPLTSHPLSLLVLLPLLFAAGTMLARVAGRAARAVRPIAIGVASAQALLALWVWHAFEPALGKADGNDGLQLIERSAWIKGLGAEWFVAVDGTNVAALVVVCLVTLAALVATPIPAKEASAHDALVLTIGAGAAGALVAEDALLWLSFVALTCLALLVALAHFSSDARASRLAAPFLALGFAALALCVALMHAESGKSFLVGGESTPATWAFPELARVAFVQKTTRVFGHPMVAAAWSLGLVGALALAGAFPLHAWLPKALASAPPSLGALTLASVGSVGLHALVRVSALMPEGARWAAPACLTLGLLGAAYSALTALAQRDLARALGFAMAAQASLALVGLASLTHQGLAGALLAVSARAAGGALLALACGAVHARLGSRDVMVVRGLASDAPVLAGVLVVGALAAMAGPGTPSGWSAALSVLGALPRGVGAAIGVGLTLALLGVAFSRAAGRMVTGRLPSELATSARLEPFGGRVPELSSREALALVLAAALVVVFGVHPAPLLGASHVPVSELGALLDPPGPGEIALAGHQASVTD